MNRTDLERCIAEKRFIVGTGRYEGGKIYLPIEITTKKSDKYSKPSLAVKCEVWTTYNGEAKQQKRIDIGFGGERTVYDEPLTVTLYLRQAEREAWVWVDSKAVGLTTANVVDAVREAYEQKQEWEAEYEKQKEAHARDLADLKDRLYAVAGVRLGTTTTIYSAKATTIDTEGLRIIVTALENATARA